MYFASRLVFFSLAVDVGGEASAMPSGVSAIEHRLDPLSRLEFEGTFEGTAVARDLFFCP